MTLHDADIITETQASSVKKFIKIVLRLKMFAASLIKVSKLKFYIFLVLSIWTIDLSTCSLYMGPGRDLMLFVGPK